MLLIGGIEEVLIITGWAVESMPAESALSRCRRKFLKYVSFVSFEKSDCCFLNEV